MQSDRFPEKLSQPTSAKYSKTGARRRLRLTSLGFFLLKWNPLLFLLALLFVVFSLWAGKPAEAATGYAGDFLRLGAGSRALAMGDAFVALAEDATAGYCNPAGLSQSRSTQLLLQHSERFAGVIQNDLIAVVIPGKAEQSFGVSLFRIGVNDIKYTKLKDPAKPLDLSQNRPYVSRRVSATDWALYLSFGHRIRSRFSAGSSLKLILRRLGDNTAFGYGIDLGFLCRPLPTLSIGANLSDLFCTPVRWDTGAGDVITPSARVGLACFWPVALLRGELTSALELKAEKESDRYDLNFSSGVEYRFRNLLALRLGSQQGRFTAGAGLRMYNRLDIDYAFLQHEDLNNSQRVSIAAQF